jgi:hypothetical protein
MKVDKSLKEVWDWKDRIYEETKTLSMEDRVNKIRADVDTILTENKLVLKIVKRGKVKSS